MPQTVPTMSVVNGRYCWGVRTALLDGERLVKEGRANLERGLEMVGGRLFLTDQRIIFESHAFNVQRGTTIIDLREVVGVEAVWTKFLKVLPLRPNSIRIETHDGHDFRVVCVNREDWIREVNDQRATRP